MFEKLKEHLNKMSEGEKQKIRDEFKSYDNNVPKGWVSIYDHLPKMLVSDLIAGGGTKYNVKFKDGTEGISIVGDHNTWFHYAKENNIIEWFNK